MGLCIGCKKKVSVEEIADLLEAVDLAAARRRERAVEDEKEEKRRRLEDAQTVLDRLPAWQAGGSVPSPLFFGRYFCFEQSDCRAGHFRVGERCPRDPFSGPRGLRP